MNREPSHPNVESLDELRENLSAQFSAATAAGSPATHRSLRRRRAALLIAAVLAVPASLAVAGEFSDEEHSFSWDGETLRMDGETLECPVDEEIQAEVGFDPCDIFSPAPAPLDTREGAESPGNSEPQGDSFKQTK